MVKKFKEFIVESKINFPSDVVSKFYKFVFNNKDFKRLNKEYSSREYYDENGDEGYFFLLFSVKKSTCAVFHNGELLSEPDAEYAIGFWEHQFMGSESKYWVYRNGEFVKPTKEEDIYFYENDEQCGIGEFVKDTDITMYYSKWLEYKEKTKEIFKKINT